MAIQKLVVPERFSMKVVHLRGQRAGLSAQV